MVIKTHKNKFLTFGISTLLLTLLINLSIQDQSHAADKPVFPKDQVAFYENEVKPLLEKHCIKCHGGKKTKAGLKLTYRDGIIKGGDFGPSYDPKKPEDSFILQMISYKDVDHEMPPDDKLPQKDIDTLTKWVKLGLPWSNEATPAPLLKDEPEFTKEEQAYWAYQKVTRPKTPAVKNQSWIKNPIDSFVLAKLESKQLSPNPKANKVALIRRAYYNLIGLPPTSQQVQDFLNDQSENAWEKVIDKLLASPQYGEKWGRHWLDLVRYAETNGYERDNPKPHVWKYRDYVIRSFNDDKPYDQFITEQIAGDELEKTTADSIIATGYYRLGIWNDEPADRLLEQYDVLDGILSTTTQVVLASTVGCARCHDHKKDAIKQADYYSMLAFIRDVSPMDTNNIVREIKTDDATVLYEQRRKEKTAKEDALHQKIYNIEQQFIRAAAKEGSLNLSSLPQSDLIDLSYKFYRDTFIALPNEFDMLRHENEGKIANNYISLDVTTRHEAIGVVYDGKLRVPADGQYTFHIAAKDGMRLVLNDKAIYNQPGVQKHDANVTVKLNKGLIPFRVEYFNVTGKGLINLGWSGPDFKRKPLSDTFLPATKPSQSADTIFADARTEPQVWDYTTTVPAKNWFKPDFDQQGWNKGTAGFGRAGTPGAVVHTNWHTANIWLRKSFNITEIPNQLKLTLHHDEDVTIYINGKQVYTQTGYLRDYKVITLPQKPTNFLQKGNNIIAVHCKHNGGGQYIDVGFYGAQGNTTTTPLPQLIKQHTARLLDNQTRDNYIRFQKELVNLKKQPISGEYALAVFERGQQKTHILRRGNPHVQGREIKPAFMRILTDEKPEIKPLKDKNSSGKRLAFAKWLTSKDNQLTARVIANRLWQFHFDKGIVATSSDFGNLGTKPTHPQLLDYLATKIMDNDWKLKAIQKHIMMSNTYQMSSAKNDTAYAKDPENNLLWRFNMRRLSAEEIRDTVLAVSGNLNLQMYGPSIYPPMPPEMIATASNPGRAWGKSAPDQEVRRSIYIHLKRSMRMPFLVALDQADTDSSCAVRFATTVPTQSLTLMNGQFMNSQSKIFAQRLIKSAPNNREAQVMLAFKLLTSRPASPDEVKQGVNMINDLIQKENVPEDEALRIFSLMALNLNELVYLD